MFTSVCTVLQVPSLKEEGEKRVEASSSTFKQSTIYSLLNDVALEVDSFHFERMQEGARILVSLKESNSTLEYVVFTSDKSSVYTVMKYETAYKYHPTHESEFMDIISNTSFSTFLDYSTSLDSTLVNTASGF